MKIKTRTRRALLGTSATFAISLIGQQSLAQGLNSTSPAPPPITPTPVVTSLPPLATVGAGGCAQQYTAAINGLSQQTINSDNIGLAANAVGATADVTGLVAQEVATAADAVAFTAMSTGLGVTVAYGVAPAPTAGGIPGSVAASVAAGTLAGSSLAKNVALGAQIVGALSTVTGVGAQIAAQIFTQNKQDLDVYVATLPDCNTEFTGTVAVTGGGMNVTGVSIFNDDLGVAADVNVEGNVNASQVYATQGISAVGGGIWIGDPNGTTYSDGITIGGGALSGAGVGGAQAITGDVDAIAIGNNAQAMMSGSVALGLNAASTGTDAVAIGNNAQATKSGSVALGVGSSSTGTDAVAIGNATAANGVKDVVVGTRNNTDAGGNNTVVGNEIDIVGAGSSDNTVLGVGHQVTGSGNFVGGDPITVIGNNNVATGANGSVTGDSNVAIGDTVNVTGDRAIAVGDNATADADDTTVVGTNAQANATGSAAYGQGAVANQPHQQVFGTQANTYSAPGITSALSRSRQVGRLEVPTSDAYGNLATDGGEIYKTLSQNQAGIAIAMAVTTPQLRGSETFGIALNWGLFQESQALAFSAAGVVANDVFGGGERLSLNGGFGLSVREKTFGGRTASTQYGGRVGVQLSW